MAWFTKKEWKNRLAEFAGRRTLTDVATGASQVVDVARNEGTISQEGDAFSAANMNEFEQRILEGFTQAENATTELNQKIDDNKNWTQAGTITKLKTDVILPNTWVDCFVNSPDGLGTLLINTKYGRNRYIVNAISGMIQRWSVKATETTVQIHDFNNNGAWESTDVNETFYVYYR